MGRVVMNLLRSVVAKIGNPTHEWCGDSGNAPEHADIPIPVIAPGFDMVVVV